MSVFIILDTKLRMFDSKLVFIAQKVNEKSFQKKNVFKTFYEVKLINHSSYSAKKTSFESNLCNFVSNIISTDTVNPINLREIYGCVRHRESTRPT